MPHFLRYYVFESNEDDARNVSMVPMLVKQTHSSRESTNKVEGSMNIRICSRKEIEALITNEFPPNTAVVSFYDPKSRRMSGEYAPVDYRGKCDRLFAVGVHDIDIEILPDYGLTFDTYLPEANALARFILQAKKDGLNLICQCEYGQSRSAACAAAVKEFFEHSGIEIFADYRYYPNQLIFNKILAALKSESALEKTSVPSKETAELKTGTLLS